VTSEDGLLKKMPSVAVGDHKICRTRLVFPTTVG